MGKKGGTNDIFGVDKFFKIFQRWGKRPPLAPGGSSPALAFRQPRLQPPCHALSTRSTPAPAHDACDRPVACDGESMLLQGAAQV